MANSMLFQDWMTLKGRSASDVVVMPAMRYADLLHAVDVIFHTEISNSSGTDGTIHYQTAPTPDDALFEDAATVLFTASSPDATIVRFASASTPISRYVRWKLTASAAWEITFRVWMTIRSG